MTTLHKSMGYFDPVQSELGNVLFHLWYSKVKTNFEEADGLGINEKKFARHIVHLTNEVVLFYALT